MIGAALLSEVEAVRGRLLSGKGPAPAHAVPAASETRVCVRVRPVLEHERELLGALIPGRSDKSFAQVDYDAVVVPPREGATGATPSHLYVLSDEKHLGVATGGIMAQPYVAHAVYSPDDGESELEAGELAGLVDCASAGGDATLLAYGQTGAGKTYSCVALQVAAARALFARPPPPGATAVCVDLSFYELAGDKIRDLLPAGDSLEPSSGVAADGQSGVGDAEPQLREGADGQVMVSGVATHRARTVSDLLAMLAEANGARRTAPTMRNTCSSRSHAFCVMNLTSPTGDQHNTNRQPGSGLALPEAAAAREAPAGEAAAGDGAAACSAGVLRIVDLAGSERWSDMYQHGQEQLQELKDNNQSLSCLKECVRIRALPPPRPGAPHPHVPYRRCTLTRLLKPALVVSPPDDAPSTGRAPPPLRRVCFLAHLSPLRSAGLHTANCLEVCLQLLAGTSSAEVGARASRSAAERWSPDQVVEWVTSLEEGKYARLAVPCFGGMSGKTLATEWLGHVIKRVAAEGGTEDEATSIYDAFHEILKRQKAAAARGSGPGAGRGARGGGAAGVAGGRSRFVRPKGHTPVSQSAGFEILVSGPPPSRQEVEAAAALAAQHNRATAERLRSQNESTDAASHQTPDGEGGAEASAGGPGFMGSQEEAAGGAAALAPAAGVLAEAGGAALAREADAVVGRATALLRALCDEAKVDESHGTRHAVAVLQHAQAALDSAAAGSPGRPIPPARALAVRLAALLHDADDRKLFPSDAPDALPNARRIGAEAGAARFGPSVLPEMLWMIKLVSCSKNGNSAPAEARHAPELLWPRWADRLEATGEIGVVRCYQWNRSLGEPLSIASTPRPQTEAEVWALATEERFIAYQARGGSSDSMLDHYYDKLLQVSKPPAELVFNAYLEAQAEARAAPLVELCLAYGCTGEVPLERLQELESKYAQKA